MRRSDGKVDPLLSCNLRRHSVFRRQTRVPAYTRGPFRLQRACVPDLQHWRLGSIARCKTISSGPASRRHYTAETITTVEPAQTAAVRGIPVFCLSLVWHEPLDSGYRSLGTPLRQNLVSQIHPDTCVTAADCIALAGPRAHRFPCVDTACSGSAFACCALARPLPTRSIHGAGQNHQECIAAIVTWRYVGTLG